MVSLKAEPANWKWPYPVFALVPQQPANDAQATAPKVSP
jgi:hypothetical protein